MNKREYQLTPQGAQLRVNDVSVGQPLQKLTIACSFDAEGALLRRHGSTEDVRAWVNINRTPRDFLQIQTIEIDQSAESQRCINLVNTALMGSTSLESLFERNQQSPVEQSEQESLDNARLREAKRCFERYDFGTEVVGMDGWTYSSPGREMACIVYVEDQAKAPSEDESAPSVRVSFTVHFESNKSNEVSEASALVMSTGGEIGHMPGNFFKAPYSERQRT